jgi:hypothetical protein
MTIEDRLPRAIDARTSSVEPSDDGLERITEKLLDQGDPTPVRFSPQPLVPGRRGGGAGGGVDRRVRGGPGDGTDEIGTATDPDSTDAPTTTGRPAETTTTAPSSTTSTSTATTTSTTTPSTSTTAPPARGCRPT